MTRLFMPRLASPLAAVRLAAALLSASCAARPPEPAPKPRPPGEAWLTREQLKAGAIETAPVADHELASEITTGGRITFDDLRVAHVFSPVTGRVVEILAQQGQRVARGAALAVIDSPDLGQAQADLAKARADEAAAAREGRRQRELAAAEAGTRRELEQAEDAERKARAEVERAAARVRLLGGGAAGSAQRYVLRAPIAGEVVARNVNPGAEVQGQYGGGPAVELFTVGAIDQVWLLADVYEMDLARVRAGSPLHVSVPAFPGRSWDATVDWVSSTLDPQTRTARLRATLRNPARELRPEMYATVRVEVERRRALAIPRQAVLRAGAEQVVFVQLGAPEVSGHVRFARRAVRLDEEAGGALAPVLQGLKAGETVVVAGAIQLLGMI